MQKVEVSDKYRDAIWILWLQGEENVPEIVKKCIESVRYFYSNKKIVILDLNSLNDYIDIPTHIQEKYQKGIIPNANFSDYVRLCLLTKYGGTWIDSTVLLTSKLPEYMMETEFFMVTKSYCCTNLDESKFDIYRKKNKFRLFPKINKKNKKYRYASWYIHSQPNNRVLLAALEFFNEYWKKENALKDYFMLHWFITFCYENDDECRKYLDDIEEVSHKYAFLLHEFGKTLYNEDAFNKILNLSCIHKLTYRSLEKQDSHWLNRIYNLDFSKTKSCFEKFEK